MWGGLHFFVSVDVLVSFATDVDAAALKGKAGNPQQKVIRSEAKQLVPATTYPNASLLLSTLKATGNRVHVFSVWRSRHLREVATLFGWQQFIEDARSLRRSPGDDLRYTLASMDCDPSWYANSVVLVANPSEWHPLLSPSLIHVDHLKGTLDCLRECGTKPSTLDGSEGVAVTDSMELLFALCRCVTLAEWRVRVAGTPVSSSYALSCANVFSCCRFLIPDALFTPHLAMMLAAHGATVVTSEGDATHILFAAPHEADEARAPPANDGGEEVGEAEMQGVSSPSTTSSSDDDDNSDTSSDSASSVSSSVSSQPPPLPLRVAESVPGNTAGPPVPTAATRPPASPSSSNDSAQFVTRNWVACCCRALRLLPVPAPVDVMLPLSATSPMELLRTTGTLLTAILPPLDARPLTFAQLDQICRAYHFPLHQLSGPSTAETCAALAKLFRGVATVRQVSLKKAAPPQAPATTEVAGRARAAEEKPQIVLCRNERKRDRDAVGEHLRLQAAQFALSWELTTRALRAARSREAGTQTSAPRFTHVGVNTCALTDTASAATQEVPEVVASATTEAVAECEPEDAKTDAANTSPATEVPAMPVEEETLGVGEEGWKAHLKNAEGKLLKSAPHGEGPPEPTKRDDGDEESSRHAEAHVTADPQGPVESAVTPAGPAQPPPPPQTRVHKASDGEATACAVPAPCTATSTTAAASIFDAPPSASIFQHPPSSDPRQSYYYHARGGPAPGPGRPFAVASSSESILPMPDLSFHTTEGASNGSGTPAAFSPFGLSPAYTASPSSPGGSSQCAIDVSALSAPQRRDFFQYLQLMPMFSSFSSTARVEEDFANHRVRCLFTTPKEAHDFLKLQYIDFGGKEHPLTLLPDPGERTFARGAPTRAGAAKPAHASLSSMRHHHEVDDVALPPPAYAAILAAVQPSSPTITTTITTVKKGREESAVVGQPKVDTTAAPSSSLIAKEAGAPPEEGKDVPAPSLREARAESASGVIPLRGGGGQKSDSAMAKSTGEKSRRPSAKTDPRVGRSDDAAGRHSKRRRSRSPSEETRARSHTSRDRDHRSSRDDRTHRDDHRRGRNDHHDRDRDRKSRR